MRAAVAWFRDVAGLLIFLLAACLMIVANWIAASKGKQAMVDAVLSAVRKS